jgi:hypothetical protein
MQTADVIVIDLQTLSPVISVLAAFIGLAGSGHGSS